MKGYIFRCNSKTFQEVFDRQLFGEEIMYLPAIKQISREDYLFLYNTSTFEFSGPYKPIGKGGERIIPEAWKGLFPPQIKFESLPSTKTISFSKIEKIIKRFRKNIYPDMELSEEQVKLILSIIKSTNF